MVTWGVTDAGARSHPAYLIESTGWRGGTTAGSLPSLDDGRTDRSTTIRQRLGGSISGKTTGLRLPAEAVSCHGTIRSDEERSVGDGPHRLVAAMPRCQQLSASAGVLTATVQFRGSATVSREHDHVEITFPSERTVTIEVEDPIADPERLTVPETPSGLARGLTALSTSHETESPSRSHPARRPHPPLLSVEEELSIPESLDGAVPTTGIQLFVPDSYRYLFVVAPLAYYLGASVDTAAVDRPRLRVPDHAVDRELPPLPEFQRACASLLRRVFYIDCLVRGAEDYVATPVLTAAGLHADRLASKDMATRLTRYLDVSDDAVSGSLPEWHLSTYVKPNTEHVPTLPYLLDDMSMVYLPAASELTDSDLLDRSLSENYRAGTPEVPSVDVLDPELRSGEVHAWLAEGTPVDAYKTTPSAYRNRRQYSDRPPGSFTVTVVLNDDGMSAEHEAVADIYRERASDLPIEVTVCQELTTGELAEEFERPTDFLHYIGHCEPDGLRCADGTLATSTLEASRTRTFFLNACGSYHEGIDLVERGSLAGAVTLTAVLDEQAATVGTAFARLVMHGFSIQRAMKLARRRVLMSKDYAVVGDGTDSLVPTPGEPAVIYLEDEDGGYRVSVEQITVGRNGRNSALRTGGRGPGDATERSLPAEQLRPFLESTSLPVIYNGRFHWSSDLAESV